MNEALIARLQVLAARLRERELTAEQKRVVTKCLSETEKSLGGVFAAARDMNESLALDEADAPFDKRSGIRVWCDGSCAPNPGPGGWGAIVEQDGRRRELSGAAPQSTNNIMELTAAIEALRTTPPGAQVHVVTDSRYLMDGLTKWIRNWKRKGWRTADDKPVKNQDLWRTLDGLAQERDVRWEWVRGHTGHPENERCDELANAARRGL